MSYTYVQLLLLIFGHSLKQDNFFKVEPNDLSLFRKLEYY